jgi:hypothetical protein
MGASLTDIRATGSSHGFIHRHYPELLLAASAIICWLVIRAIPITNDVVWQFWIARQMLGGAKLYTDIWELNPPLWFWSALPIQWLGEYLHVQPLRILILLIVAMGALSAYLVGRLGQFASAPRRCGIILLTFLVTVPMPLYDFGQREQLALICALPYAALAANRYTRTPISIPLAILIGLMSAYGFALKHYFVVVPLLLELWLLTGLRRQWRPIRPETVTLAVSALLYAMLVLWLAPDFLARIVPMVSAAYYGFAPSIFHMISRPMPVLWGICLLTFIAYRRGFGKDAEPILSAILLVSFGFAFAYFMQRKGWSYHTVPVTGALFLAVGIRITADGLRKALRYPIGVIALTFGISFCFALGPYKNYMEGFINPLLDTVPRGEPVLGVVTDPMWTWPELEQRGLLYPSTLYSYWMMAAVANAQVNGPNPASLRAVADSVLDRTAQDLRCHPPMMVVVQKPLANIDLPPGYDMRDFFLSDAGIRAFMAAHYREEASTRQLYVYRRQHAVPPSRDAHCRHLR